MLNYLPYRWFEDVDGEKVLKTNVCNRVGIPPKIKNDPLAYLEYTIKDGEDPRDIAQRYYGSSEDFWLILLMNDIHDLKDGWPDTRNGVRQRVEEAFGSDMTSVHHYENAKGEYIDPLGVAIQHGLEDEETDVIIERFNLKPVTVLEHYQRVNDNKRQIKVLKVGIADSVRQAVAEVFS